MAQDEVTLRISLAGRREAAKGLTDTKEKLQDVGQAGGTAATGLAKASDKKWATGFARISRSAQGLAGKIGRGLASAAKTGAKGLGILTIAGAALGVQSVQLASDAAETGSAFGTIFGDSAAPAQEWVDQMHKSYGIASADLQEATSGFATLGKMAGETGPGLSTFATDLAQAGLDLGSFYNAGPEEAFGAIQSGLAGEAESLKRFNIFMSDAALNAFALKQGLDETTQEMSEQEKVALRQSFIMAHLGDAQGDLARTSAGYANQQRGLTGRVKEFLTMLGGPLMTVGAGAMKGLSAVVVAASGELTSKLPGMEAGAASLATRLEAAGVALAEKLPGAIETIGDKWEWLMGKWDALAAKVSGGLGGGDMGEQWATLVGHAKDLGPALSAAGEQLPGVTDAMAVLNTVTGFLAQHTDTLIALMPWLVAGFVLMKVAALAAVAVAIIQLPLTIAQTVANFVMGRGAAALAAQLAILNGVERVSTLTKIKNLAVMVGQRIAIAALTAASWLFAGVAKAITAAQWLMNAAMSANPIGLVVAAVVLLVGGLVLAYKKSETFRKIVDATWAALKTAGVWVKDLGMKVGVWVIGKFVKAKSKVDSIRDAIGRFVDKVKDGIGWVKDLGSTISNIPGMGFLGDLAGSIPGLAKGGPVQAGHPYIVGDGGQPELFVPRVAGQILPQVPDPVDMSGTLDEAGVGGGDLHVRLEVDGRTLGEVVVDDFRNRGARR